MKSLGSKQKLMKHIGPIIKELSQDRTSFYDVTLGGGSVAKWIFENGGFQKMFLSDKSQLVIAGTLYIKHNREEWENLTQQDVPKWLYETWRKKWRKERQSSNNNHWPELDLDNTFHRLIGWSSFMLAHSGRCFANYAEDKDNTDYVAAAIRHSQRQYNSLLFSSVKCLDYRDVVIDEPCNSTLFADPPYKGKHGYIGGEKNFDHQCFWDTMHQHHLDGVQVFVTESTGDHRFAKLWSSGDRYANINNLIKPKDEGTAWSDNLYVPKELVGVYREQLKDSAEL